MTRRLVATAGEGLTELQGVTIDFCILGRPPASILHTILQLWPQAARPLYALVRMYM